MYFLKTFTVAGRIKSWNLIIAEASFKNWVELGTDQLCHKDTLEREQKSPPTLYDIGLELKQT